MSELMGGNELLTTCKVRDAIQWTATSIDPGNDVAITAITGQAVQSAMIDVDNIPQGGVVSTQAYVAKPGVHVQYSMTLNLDDETTMSFDPFITANARASGDDEE